MSLYDLFGDPIHKYTRKQAIEDGVLIDVSTKYPRDTRMYKFPVAITSEVWALIAGKNEAVWVWDICYMSIKYVVERPDPSTVIFKVILPSEPGSGKTETYRLKGICSPGDDMEPVITIMFENQD